MNAKENSARCRDVGPNSWCLVCTGVAQSYKI